MRRAAKNSRPSHDGAPPVWHRISLAVPTQLALSRFTLQYKATRLAPGEPMKEFVVAPTQTSSRWRRVFSWASARKALKVFAILALIGFVGVVALLASLWWE